MHGCKALDADVSYGYRQTGDYPIDCHRLDEVQNGSPCSILLGKAIRRGLGAVSKEDSGLFVGLLHEGIDYVH